MSGHLQEMVNVSRDFCLSIDFMDEYDTEQWLADLNRILARMQYAMVHLQSGEADAGFFALPDLEERFEVFCRLKDKLGCWDEYFLESDAWVLDAEKTGSLAGDLTDVFFEIRRGLGFLDSKDASEEDSLDLWQSGFYLHWGRHLVNAIRQLHLISVDCYFIRRQEKRR